MKNIRLEDRWPLIIVDWLAAFSHEEFDEHFAAIDGYLARKEGFAIVNKIASMKALGPKWRRYAADKISAQMEMRRRYLKAEAMVTPSLLIRGGLTAVFWMTNPGYPHKVFGDVDAAIEWARSKLTP